MSIFYKLVCDMMLILVLVEDIFPVYMLPSIVACRDLVW